MAAYAALVSLMHIIEQIEHHPHPPISLDKTQVQSLIEKITFLQEFLEGYSHVGYSNEADDLEMRIADAAYAAEDLIESHVVDQIHPRSTSLLKKIRSLKFFRGLQKVKSHGKKISSVDLYEGLQKVVQEMDLIEREAMEKTGVKDFMHREVMPASSVSCSSKRQNITVGLDDVLIKIVDKLTDGQHDRQIIPIVGMGGSGKTTLAKNVFQNKVVMQHFDIYFWVTISQKYRVGEVLSELLSQNGGESESERNECELGARLHKRLSGRRYLIVMDDIWDIKLWDQLNLYFPNNGNESRIVLTTRLLNLAHEVANSRIIKMGLLDENNSWDLFSKIVFGEEGCPFELVGFGKQIVRKCKGLPLAIVVVGGLLVKTERKREYWEHTSKNLSSALYSEDDKSCLNILYMSYTELPVYLKPCFLYMGVFPEDEMIYVSTLVRLWVAEGFLKPIRGKSLEKVARGYLKELIDRNLIHIHRLGSTGNIKICKMHDLLRDLCLREAEKESFYTITRQQILPQCINSSRRIIVVDTTSNEKAVAFNTGSLVRSLIWNSYNKVPFPDFRLLRVLKEYERYPMPWGKYFWRKKLQLFNLRYICTRAQLGFKWGSSFHLFWNLQTLIFHYTSLIAPSEIWNMRQLRHIECKYGVILPNPPSGCNCGQHDNVLVNLRKLTMVIWFECGEEMVKRIPNIENLKLNYKFSKDDLSVYCFNNFERLHKLESLSCTFPYEKTTHPSQIPELIAWILNDGWPTSSLRKLTFPHSLKKLSLELHNQHWDDIMDKIGSLPLLEKLRLTGGSFHRNKWETVEGQFRSLKFLEIRQCSSLEYWTTDYTHFPCLQHLVLHSLRELKEIPSGIGEIPTLETIEVIWCSDGAVISAKEIATEQEALGNEDFRVEVSIDRRCRNKALVSLETTPNFQVSS